METTPVATPREHALAIPSNEAVLRAVFECSTDLASLRDRAVILRAILRRTRALLGTDMSYLSLNDLGAGETYIHVTEGVETEDYRNIRMPLGTGVLGAVAAGGATVQTRDYLRNPAMNHLPEIDRIVEGEGVKAIMGSPLRVGGRVVGALLVAHRTAVDFEPQSVFALEQMSTQAAIALEQTRLSEEIARLHVEVGATETTNARRQRDLEDVLRLDERLTGSLLTGSGLNEVVDLLNEAIGLPVALYDPAGRLLIGEDLVEASVLAGWEVQGAITASLHGGGAATVRVVDEALLLMTASAGVEHLATLVVAGATTPVHHVMVERASVFASVILLFERTLIDADNRAQSTLFDDLLHARSTTSPALESRAAEYGIPLGEPLVVVVVKVPDAVRYATLGAVRDLLVSAPALVSMHAGAVCAIVATDTPERLAEQLVASLGSRSISALVGRSTAEGGLADLSTAHHEAHRVVEAQRALGWNAGQADVVRLGLAGIIVSGADPSLVDAIVQKSLGTLLAYDSEKHTALTITASTYLEAGGNLDQVAQALHIHRNTVRQRAERIDLLLGPTWRVPPRSLDTHVALRLWRLRTASGG